MYDFATWFLRAITRNCRRTSNSVSDPGRSSFSSRRMASGTVASIKESRESYPIPRSISLTSSSHGPPRPSTNDGNRMFVSFPETFLLSIAKHGVEGRELQVAGEFCRPGSRFARSIRSGCPRLVPTYRDQIVSDPTNLPLKQSPLHGEHLKLGAKMIGFGGWNMPVFYSSILEEHQAVRQRVGIFDISHMGQIRVSGPSAEHWLNTLLTNNLKKLEISEGQYTLLLNPEGGVLAELIDYARGQNGD